MIDKDTIIKLANDCGIWIPMGSDKDAEVAKLQALIQSAYKMGLEDAAQVAEAQQDLAEQEKADKRFKDAIKEGDERNAVDRGEHWMCVTTCNAVLRNAAKAIRSLKEQP